MTRDEQFLEGVEKLGLHVEPNLDTSARDEYVVVSFSCDGTLYGDDAPALETRNWQIAYVAPVGYDRTEIRNSLRWLIFEIYGAWPGEENVSDASGQRFMYEFSTFGGIDNGTA